MTAAGTFTVAGSIDLRSYDVVDVSAQDYGGTTVVHQQSVLQGPLTQSAEMTSCIRRRCAVVEASERQALLPFESGGTHRERESSRYSSRPSPRSPDC